jgi:hypothetical protein
VTTLYRYTTTFTGATGAPWYNQLWFYGSGGSGQSAADAAGVFWGAIDNYMKSTVTWSGAPEIEEVLMETGELTGLIAVTPHTGTGGSSAEMGPIGTQALIKWRTGVFLGGREVRGRTFVPGLSEDSNDPTGAVGVTTRTALDTAAAALISDASSVFGVYSRTNRAMYAAASGTTNTSWSFLRSRRT